MKEYEELLLTSENVSSKSMGSSGSSGDQDKLSTILETGSMEGQVRRTKRKTETF